MINNKHNLNEGDANTEELFEDIIIAETDFEEDMTFSNLNKLFDLYLKGSKVYEMQNEEKAKMFERKMINLIQKPIVKAMLKEKQNEKNGINTYLNLTSEKIKQDIIKKENNVNICIQDDIERQNSKFIEKLNAKKGNKNNGNSNSSTTSTNSEGKGYSKK